MQHSSTTRQKLVIVAVTTVDFWNHRHQSYPLLAPLADDLVSAPASQAYVERVFSVCGDLCARKRSQVSAEPGLSDNES